MNYLAHFHLAGQDESLIEGALLGDFVKGPLQGRYSAAVESGIRLHRHIDAFSDSDQEVTHLKRNLPDGARRYGGIITDVVFDYYLSRHWSTFHSTELPVFSRSIYRILGSPSKGYPASAQRFSRRLIDHDLLCQYGHWSTVDQVLKSIARRLPFDSPLSQGTAVVEGNRAQLEEAFLDFYPRVQTQAEKFRRENKYGT